MPLTFENQDPISFEQAKVQDKMYFVTKNSATAVSYTHLDVYKRQVRKNVKWNGCFGKFHEFYKIITKLCHFTLTETIINFQLKF